MNIEGLKSRAMPLLLSGTRSDSLDERLAGLGAGREQSLLNALSLTGQALRFTRPASPSEFAVEVWPSDERTIVPDHLRGSILRLLNKCTEDTARALALALEKQRLRPHPFDLPKLDGFIRKYAERLGVTAQYWAQRAAPTEQMRGYFDAGDLTEETWLEGPIRLRAQFLRDLRKSQSGTARMLLEKSWPGENPESRLLLLATLQIGLTVEDQPFIESVRKDRAPRVRATAQRLLATISGASSDHPALASCMERIQRSTSGLLKKRDVLSLELPVTVKEHEVNRWIHEQFAYVTLDQLARAYEMTGTGLIEASAKDDNLLFAFALLTCRDHKFDLLPLISERIPDAWGRMSELDQEDGSLDDAGQRVRWAEALIRPKKWLPEAPFPAWSWLHRQMEGPLPANVMREVLNSSQWSALLEQEKKGATEVVQVICALCPAELRSSLRKQIEPLDVGRKDKGWMLLDILDTLEKLK